MDFNHIRQTIDQLIDSVMDFQEEFMTTAENGQNLEAVRFGTLYELILPFLKWTMSKEVKSLAKPE